MQNNMTKQAKQYGRGVYWARWFCDAIRLRNSFQLDRLKLNGFCGGERNHYMYSSVTEGTRRYLRKNRVVEVKS